MSATATIAAGPQHGPQHMQALELANRVRLARAELKRCVGRGEVTASDVVARCPWEVESMPICDLLMSQRRWGITRCRKLLNVVDVPERKAIGTLTDRQRGAIVAALSGAGFNSVRFERAGLRPVLSI